MKKGKITFNTILTVLLVLLIMILVFLLISKIGHVDIEEKYVQDLYAYIGNPNKEYCGGLLFYNDNLDINTLTESQKKCIAFANISADKIEDVTYNKKKKKDYCIATGDKKFELDEKGSNCSATNVDFETLKSVYYRLFGLEIANKSDFELSGTKVCYYIEKSDSYTCGTPTIKTLEMGWGPTSYRMLVKAKEKGNKIFLHDYLLLINDGKCFVDNLGQEENVKCSKEIKENFDVTNRFIKKYGRKYIHVFEKDKDNNYYWKSSTQA